MIHVCNLLRLYKAFTSTSRLVWKRPDINLAEKTCSSACNLHQRPLFRDKGLGPEQSTWFGSRQEPAKSKQCLIETNPHVRPRQGAAKPHPLPKPTWRAETCQQGYENKQRKLTSHPLSLNQSTFLSPQRSSLYPRP